MRYGGGNGGSTTIRVDSNGAEESLCGGEVRRNGGDDSAGR